MRKLKEHVFIALWGCCERCCILREYQLIFRW